MQFGGPVQRGGRRLVALSAILLLPIALPAADLRVDDIVTVLPKNAIPAIMDPAFASGERVSWILAKDLVVGVEIQGDSRAYPVSTLSRHEIVNDTVGGVPIAVTW
jgi:hypothetical protein